MTIAKQYVDCLAAIVCNVNIAGFYRIGLPSAENFPADNSISTIFILLASERAILARFKSLRDHFIPRSGKKSLITFIH